MPANPNRSAPPASPPDPYRRGLWVARALALPGGLAVLGGLAYLLAAGSVGHGSLPAVVLPIGLLVALLPLLLFWPDGGPGARSRAVHVAGGFSLVLGLLVASALLWSRFGAAGAKASSIESTLRQISLLDTHIEPMRVGQVTAGYRLTMRFQLASEFKAGAQKFLIASTLSQATLVPTDGLDPRRDNGAFAINDERTRLVRPGGPAHANDILPGIYTLTKELWMPYVNRPGDRPGPCRLGFDTFTPTLKARVETMRATRWVAEVQAAAPDAQGRFQTVWRARSAPITLDYDGAAWLQGLDALGLPDCRSAPVGGAGS